MSQPSRQQADSEVERVRAAYSKRPVKDARYSWFLPGQQFIVQRRETATLAALARHGITELDTLRILELGCGEGYWLREFVKWGAAPDQIYGVDVVLDRLRLARRRAAPSVALLGASGEDLPFPDAAFDVVIQSTVFSSILDSAIRQHVAREMIRVLRPGGHVLWYDFFINNPRNPDVRGVGKAEIRRLFAGCEIDLHRTTLAPPIARRLAGVSWLGCVLLEQLPLLRTHLLGVLTKT